LENAGVELCQSTLEKFTSELDEEVIQETMNALDLGELNQSDETD